MTVMRMPFKLREDIEAFWRPEYTQGAKVEQDEVPAVVGAGSAGADAAVDVGAGSAGADAGVVAGASSAGAGSDALAPVDLGGGVGVLVADAIDVSTIGVAVERGTSMDVDDGAVTAKAATDAAPSRTAAASSSASPCPVPRTQIAYNVPPTEARTTTLESLAGGVTVSGRNPEGGASLETGTVRHSSPSPTSQALPRGGGRG